jgi:hypothetical protein
MCNFEEQRKAKEKQSNYFAYKSKQFMLLVQMKQIGFDLY